MIHAADLAMFWLIPLLNLSCSNEKGTSHGDLTILWFSGLFFYKTGICSAEEFDIYRLEGRLKGRERLYPIRSRVPLIGKKKKPFSIELRVADHRERNVRAPVQTEPEKRLL